MEGASQSLLFWQLILSWSSAHHMEKLSRSVFKRLPTHAIKIQSVGDSLVYNVDLALSAERTCYMS